jgi:hypothetical protein
MAARVRPTLRPRPLAALVLGLALAAVAGGCGIAASTAVPSFSAAPVGPDATVSPAVAQTRAAIAAALGASSLQLQDAKQPFRPAESPRLATAPRAVYQVVLPQEPDGGYIVVYEFRDASEAVNAGNEYAGYVGSGGAGKVQFPTDVQHTIRQVGTTLIVYSYSPAISTDPGSAQIAQALKTLGIGFAPPS